MPTRPALKELGWDFFAPARALGEWLSDNFSRIEEARAVSAKVKDKAAMMNGANSA